MNGEIPRKLQGTTKKGSPHPSILPADIPLSDYFSLMVDPLLQTTS